MNHKKLLVAIATYNEKENIKPLVSEIKNNYPADILFIDDNSPDGTGNVIDELASHDPTIRVIHRAGKLGTGTAFIEAFTFARKNNYDILITMDADFTHDPIYFKPLLAAAESHDIVIGSRYKEGGKMSGWHWFRLPFTLFWRSMIKRGLGLQQDATGAYRAYRVAVLKPEIIQEISSRGFAFQMESLYRFVKHGARVTEVPIHARSRIHGESKLSFDIMQEVARKYCRLLFDRLFNHSQPRLLKHNG